MMPLKSIRWYVLTDVVLNLILDSVFTTERAFETRHPEDGGADTHDRVDVLSQRIGDRMNVVITTSLVKQIVKERKVKIMFIYLSCVRFPSNIMTESRRQMSIVALPGLTLPASRTKHDIADEGQYTLKS